jgi:hypothetical protein
MATKAKRPSVEEIILKAVTAQRVAGERQPQNAFRSTENRLYAYPVIQQKIANDRERISDIQQHGVSGVSRSVIKYQRSGLRLTPEEISEALVRDITADIAENEGELETIEKALGIIAGDTYEAIVKFKYFEWKNDDEIADLMTTAPKYVLERCSFDVV